MSSSRWVETAEFFSAHGFSGLSISHANENLEAAIDKLENFIVHRGLVNPVLVSHSSSTFVAQKYLESFSLRGLIMLNPWPPNALRISQILKNQWLKSDIGVNSKILFESKPAHRLLDYYNIKDAEPNFVSIDITTVPAIIEELSQKGNELVVKLEPGIFNVYFLQHFVIQFIEISIPCD